ncbi:MAG: hypothetical protein EHM71_09065 [Zetaproteobacteria bacterium]|nr:MAG: hypothetical protein EHM71_09065 [Zetaproteobacteria bacterium]
MTTLRVSLLTCTLLAGVTLGLPGIEGAEAQMAPALGREGTPPHPPPPALARESTPIPSTERVGAAPQAAKPAPAAPASGQAETPWWSTRNAMTMSAALLVFGVVVLVLATYLITTGKSAEAVLRIFGTILIIVIAVFLVVAGYSDTQIAPVMGLLGTIAGYLLGKESREKPATPEPPPGDRPNASRTVA